MCWCIATGIRISWVASIGLIVQGLLVSIGLGSWGFMAGASKLYPFYLFVFLAT